MKQTLRADEARMFSVHKVKNHPQVISVNRHIMQGFVSFLRNPIWNDTTLSGTSKVVKNDPYTLTIALNGRLVADCKVESEGASCTINNELASFGLAEVTILTDKSEELKWQISFE